jgi:hypothetical protein
MVPGLRISAFNKIIECIPAGREFHRDTTACRGWDTGKLVDANLPASD